MTHRAAAGRPHPAGILLALLITASILCPVIAAVLFGVKNGCFSAGPDRAALAQILGCLRSFTLAGLKLTGLFLFYCLIARLWGTRRLLPMTAKAASIALPCTILFFLAVEFPLGPFQAVNYFVILVLFIAALLCVRMSPGTKASGFFRDTLKRSPLRGLIIPAYLLFLGLALLAPSIHAAWTARPRGTSVLLVSIDTLRADHLGCYGYPRPVSPHIDRLASRSAMFTQCLVQDHWTLPSHMSMMTSLYPDRHQVYPETTLPDGIPTLAQILCNAGYNTRAFISGIHWMSPGFGFHRGFLHYDFPQTIIRAEDIQDRALKWLEKNHRKPFFLFLHFYDVHADSDIPPYYKNPVPADPALETYPPYEDTNKKAAIVEGYDLGIQYVDHAIGEITNRIEALGIEDLVTVITSDHGEEFFDHGMIGHLQAYEETARVPLIVKTPEMETHHRIDALVQSIDIAPTILSYLDLPVPPLFQGRSLLSCLRAGDEAPERKTEAFIKGNWNYVIRTPRWKLFRHDSEGESFLFDLESDPAETVNLIASRPEVTDRLNKRLEKFLSCEGKPPAHYAKKKKGSTSQDRKEKEKLKALGYIW